MQRWFWKKQPGLSRWLDLTLRHHRINNRMQYYRADNCSLTNLKFSMYDYISRIFQLLKKGPALALKRSGCILACASHGLVFATCIFMPSTERHHHKENVLGVSRSPNDLCKLTSMIATLPLVHGHYVPVQLCALSDTWEAEGVRLQRAAILSDWK